MAEGSVIEKQDTGKPPMGFLAVLRHELGEVAKVLAFGNKKYDRIDNFQGIAQGRERMIDAGLRHVMADASGEHIDPESGLPHLAHGVCCFLMALWFLRNKPEQTSVRIHEVWSQQPGPV